MIKGRQANRGFTVVQMLLMLAGVLLFVWYFSPETYTHFLGRKIDADAALFADSLRDARSNAKDRKVSVTMCKSEDGKQCNSRLQWQAGWIYFSDLNGNGKVDSSEDEILRVISGVDKNTTIGSQEVVLSSVTFAAAGHTLSKKGNPVAGKFVVCDGFKFTDKSRIVSFNYQGSVHIESPQGVQKSGCGG